MTKKDNIKYNITEKDVVDHAPTVLYCIKEHYNRLAKISKFMDSNSVFEFMINAAIPITGITPEYKMEYSKELLNNSNFRISVIYHLCMSNVCGCILSWETYLGLKVLLDRSIMNTDIESLSVDSISLKKFNVDPLILPRDYLSRTMKLDEFNKAVELIIENTKNMKYYSDFMDYDAYYEYAKTIALDLQKKCHENCYYGTHDIDRFAALLISNRMKLPTFDLLYVVNENRPPFNIATEGICDVQRKMLNQIFHEGDG